MKPKKHKPFFKLVLHDLGNLAFQIVEQSSDLETLEIMAERMNFLFAQAGNKQFKAEVYEL
jgi:hypothetical protein